MNEKGVPFVSKINRYTIQAFNQLTGVETWGQVPTFFLHSDCFFPICHIPLATSRQNITQFGDWFLPDFMGHLKPVC